MGSARRVGAVAMATAGLAAGALSAAAVPAAADVIDPFAKRYDESLYGDFKTIGNTVMGCPTTPADGEVSCTAGAIRVITVTAPGSNCPRSVRGGDDPCTSAVHATRQRVQARPAPQHQQGDPARPAAASGPGQLADTGSGSGTMLYAGLAISLSVLGALAVAAARSRRD
ncbi:hypothetical protein ACFVXC_14565 [Streptomyces sp. NPDC058257]|uniref:hypothetical protein n=1 Tax=Streptomyces sp. NPDC058257 TaxID=3346409 RepID=UPI0036E8B615